MAPAEEDSIFSGLTPIFRKTVDGFFGPRAVLNRERWDALLIDSAFKRDLEKIRLDERIPKLHSKSDLVARWVPISDDEEIDETTSDYLDNLPNRRRRRIENAIRQTLNKYSLPLNFYDWVQYLLLYRKSLKGSPRYDWQFLDNIIDNPAEARRIPLNTIEKRFWLKMFKWRLGIGKGRVPKQYAKAYKELKQRLSTSPKNRQRRSRTHDDTVEVLERKGTYMDFVAEISPNQEDMPSPKEDMRVAAKLRRRNSRFSKRHNLPRKGKN